MASTRPESIPPGADESTAAPTAWPGMLSTIVLGAMAGGMGWGIRGQYGHETGAMIAGVLVGFVVVLLFLPRAASLRGARAVALTAVGISFGGSMTYGQTLGLSHDPHLVGNWAALRWGMLGTFIKGGIWFGFAGAFLGMALGGKRWKPLEMVAVLLGMLALIVLGMRVLNAPFDPPSRTLPTLYFSADWYWRPEAGPELKPRPESWGGQLFALLGLVAYAWGARGDRLARNLAVVGFIAGGIGFPLGQCIQAYHAWNRPWFQTDAMRSLDAVINWWNMMEITFGTIGGAGLAWGVWANRRRILPDADADAVSISPPWELVMVAAHLTLLVSAEFHLIPGVPMFLEYGPVIALIALPGIVGGRYWPYLFALPIVATPISGKTLNQLAYRTDQIAAPLGWITLVAAPLAVALAAALWLERRGRGGQPAGTFAAVGLLVATWLYFGLNFAFFEVPWPWQPWTARTPSALIFVVCSIGLTAAACRGLARRPASAIDEDRRGAVAG